MSSLDDRVAFLIDFLGLSEASNVEELLHVAGFKAVEYLKENAFSEPGPHGRRLTNRGYALAADMGLLVAKLLLDNHGGRIRWRTIRKPKSELSYNLPVLEGFADNYLDPVGGATAEASAILRGQRDENTWKNIYVFWRDNVSNG